jgi:hypothetical protein
MTSLSRGVFVGISDVCLLYEVERKVGVKGALFRE